MNIISNDCVGGYVYRDNLKCDFLNPFIWSSINLENFCKIIVNYNEINFSNIQCVLSLNESGICKKQSLIPKIIIDNEIEVNYFHYIFDEKYEKPVKSGPYTLFNDIVAYTVDSYNRRLSRMKEPPIFVWDVTKCLWYNKENKVPYDVFSSLKTNFKIIIYQPDIISGVNENIILLNKKNGSFEVNVSAENIYKNILNKLV